VWRIDAYDCSVEYLGASKEEELRAQPSHLETFLLDEFLFSYKEIR